MVLIPAWPISRLNSRGHGPDLARVRWSRVLGPSWRQVSKSRTAVKLVSLKTVSTRNTSSTSAPCLIGLKGVLAPCGFLGHWRTLSGSGLPAVLPVLDHPRQQRLDAGLRHVQALNGGREAFVDGVLALPEPFDPLIHLMLRR